jgi:hypothetical protein
MLIHSNRVIECLVDVDQVNLIDPRNISIQFYIKFNFLLPIVFHSLDDPLNLMNKNHNVIEINVWHRNVFDI